MSQAVSDIIMARSRQSDGVMTMAGIWSLGIHAAVLGVLMLMPDRNVDEAPRSVMMISLGGAPGPKTDGMTQIGGRAVQARAEATPRGRSSRIRISSTNPIAVWSFRSPTAAGPGVLAVSAGTYARVGMRDAKCGVGPARGTGRSRRAKQAAARPETAGAR